MLETIKRWGGLKILLLFSILLNVVLASGFFIHPHDLSKLYNLETKVDERVNFPYLSARIFVENKNDTFVGFKPLRNALREYSESLPKDAVGIYFEYLPSGSNIGVNERKELPLASLFKVPAVIGVYEMIQNGTITKDTVLTVEEKHIDKDFGTFWQNGVGAKITVADAIDKTLIDSDNTAVNVLYELLSNEKRRDLFDDLDLPIVEAEDGYLYVTGSPKSYTSILRALYLSTFLDKKHSNEILDILTRTKFNDKIPAGVAPGIKVAHKIGVYQRLDTGTNVYSDCGIIYYPKRPYSLCVMVEGTEEEATNHIKYISKMVYGYISQVNLSPSKEGF